MTDEEFNLLRTLVYRGTNIYCPDTQKFLFERKIRTRLTALQLASFQAYYTLLTSSAFREEEFLHLIDVIAIHETSFFRIPGHFQGLETLVFPTLLQRPQTTVRVWSTGCSTGEEPYSIAMSFLEACARFQAPSCPSQKLHILATDVSSRVIEIARQGTYPPQKVQKIPQAFLDKYFMYQDDHYRVQDHVKELVTFQVFNLIHINTPPAANFDVIFCRNLLIYFDRPAQLSVITGFVHLLKPGGYLFLGDAESLHTFHHIADTIDIFEAGNALIYQKRGVQTS